jgi:hypothetical protein
LLFTGAVFVLIFDHIENRFTSSRRGQRFACLFPAHDARKKEACFMKRKRTTINIDQEKLIVYVLSVT